MASSQIAEEIDRVLRSNSLDEAQTVYESKDKGAREMDNFDENAATLSRPSRSEEEPLVLLDFEEVDFLVKENMEMKALISDYHRGVETLMKVFRKRVLDNIEEKKSTESDQNDESDFLQGIILRQSQQIYEMRELMKRACDIDEEEENFMVERISFLRKENLALRELYDISRQIGLADLKVETKDQGCQTDDPFQAVKAVDDVEAVKDAESNSENDDDDVKTIINMNLHESDNDEDDQRDGKKCPEQAETIK